MLLCNHGGAKNHQQIFQLKTFINDNNSYRRIGDLNNVDNFIITI
jgi:hypothetical protein